MLCQRCGIQGGADLAFIWFPKTFAVRRKSGGATRERTLWLCPDCANELGSARKRVTPLSQILQE